MSLPSLPADWHLAHRVLATEQGPLAEGVLDATFERTETGALDEIPPAEVWPELARGL
jgi:hypothetical protein